MKAFIELLASRSKLRHALNHLRAAEFDGVYLLVDNALHQVDEEIERRQQAHKKTGANGQR